MGILSRVFKSFSSVGYAPSQTESKRLSESRIGSAIAATIRQARTDAKLVKRAKVVDWRLWTPDPDTLDDSRVILATGWGEGMPQTLTERTLCLWILSIMKDIRVFAGMTKRSKGQYGRKYLRRFWEGNIKRLFADPECAFGDMFNECWVWATHTLPELNRTLAKQGKKIRKLTRSGVVGHLVATTYAGTNPRGNEFFFARSDGDWFSRTKPYLRIKSKVDAEKLIARGYLFGWDKNSESEIRIPIHLAFVRSLDTYHNADRRGEYTRMESDRGEALFMLDKCKGILTESELLIVEAIARNPNATHTEIAKSIGWDGGIGKGYILVKNTLGQIRAKVNREEWAESLVEV